MNQQAKTAFNQYKDLARAWQITNPDMAECASQLIQSINDNATGSTQEIRQDVQAVTWESLLSGFPTEVIQEEMKRRSVTAIEIGSDSPVCPGCGQYMTIEKTGNGRFEMWESHCECIVGSEIAIPYQSTREELIKKQNLEILAYQCK